MEQRREPIMVECPLLKRKINNNIDCFVIASVAENAAPDNYAPKEVFAIDNWREICNNCKYNLMYK